MTKIIARLLPILVFFSNGGALGLKAPVGADLFYGEASENLIIRWGFQNICDHAFDPRTGEKDQPSTRTPGGLTFDPKAVKPGDIIFVRKIDLFMQTMHPKILNPYIMLTHGDFLDTCREQDVNYLDDKKIIAWFSIHPPKRFHEKFFPIPLGILQKKEHFTEKTRYSKLFSELRMRSKQRLAAITFDEDRNAERGKVLKLFADKHYCYNPGETNFIQYLEALASCKFAFSPRGFGPDCYRTWEALLVGTIPIVRRGQYDVMEIAKKWLRTGHSDRMLANLDRLYEDLPVLIIDDWNEINEEFLNKKYAEITSKKYNIEKLYLEYWQNYIMRVKEAFCESCPLSNNS